MRYRPRRNISAGADAVAIAILGSGIITVIINFDHGRPIAGLPSCKGPPAESLLRPTRPARCQGSADPAVQNADAARPSQHGAGNAEIVMLPEKAFVDVAALAQLGLKRHELLMSAPRHQPVNNADLIGLQFALIEFEQI